MTKPTPPAKTIYLIFNGENNPEGEWLWCEDAIVTPDTIQGDVYEYKLIGELPILNDKGEV